VAIDGMICLDCQVGWDAHAAEPVTACWCCGKVGEKGSIYNLLHPDRRNPVPRSESPA
jgi:hypothetical protein